MGEILKKKLIIKNLGVIVVLLTIYISLWFLAQDLNYVIENKILLFRIIGVTLLSVCTYIPYFILHKYVNDIKFLEIILIISIIFAVMNIYFLVNIMINSDNYFGIFGIFIYEILFIFVVSVFIIIDQFLKSCLAVGGNCYQIKTNFYKKFSVAMISRK